MSELAIEERNNEKLCLDNQVMGLWRMHRAGDVEQQKKLMYTNTGALIMLLLSPSTGKSTLNYTPDPLLLCVDQLLLLACKLLLCC